jgi:hypothetical protein
MKTEIERFLVLFSRLQAETKQNAANLEWLPKEKTFLYDLCCDIDSTFRKISCTFLKKKKKHTIAPQIFSNRWDEYKRKWESMVAKVAKIGEELAKEEVLEVYQKWLSEEYEIKENYEAWLKAFEDNLIIQGKLPKEYYKEIGKQPEELYNDGFKKIINDPEEYLKIAYEDIYDISEERLDLLEDSPAAIMDELYDYLSHFVSNDYFDGIINSKHLEAWDFYKDSIGIDFLRIYDRWKSSPDLIISTHMANRNTTTLEELYNEAVRCYLFGLTEASVAMCRALMEYVLKTYFKISGEGLSRIISEAEKRYTHLRGLNLKSKKDLANRVLHDYENRGQEIEKAALDFLQTIRHLVTHVGSP